MASFGSFSFVIPQFEIFKVKEKTFAALNMKTDHREVSQIHESLSRLNKIIVRGEHPDGTIPKTCSLKNFPNRYSWEKIFNNNIRHSGHMISTKSF